MIVDIGKVEEVETRTPSIEEIAAAGALMMAVPLKMALPLDHRYKPGTKAGYPCVMCEQDCILTPHGQKLFALGKNQLVCVECVNAVNNPQGED
ncbi:MAG TPA: hypothetical protein VHA06_07050 [Candidatus Angelobacter sp.]|jgi:NAD-dependent dihydropyrimidine dehydrogenase PreA subunit|nr:hypothetical protein [Candidatus Angelobacter sp.]